MVVFNLERLFVPRITSCTAMNNYELARMLENIVIRDPRTGNTAYHKEIEKRIEQFHQEINALRSKGEAFLDKVVSYYQQKKGSG